MPKRSVQNQSLSFQKSWNIRERRPCLDKYIRFQKYFPGVDATQLFGFYHSFKCFHIIILHNLEAKTFMRAVGYQDSAAGPRP
jgi:hypothetical protein